MAIAIGRPDIEEAIEGPSSVDSIRLMWWKQYVYPMIYHSSRDFTGLGTGTVSSAEAGYDYDQTWRKNTNDFAPAPRPALPADPNGGVYSTSYIDAFLSRTPTYFGEGTDAGEGTLALGILDGYITQEEFIGMSKSAARGVISQITSRMHYVVEFWVGQIERGYITPDLWFSDTGAGPTYLVSIDDSRSGRARLRGDWRSFSNRVKNSTTLDTYTLKAAIADAKLWAKYFKYNPDRDSEIYPDGDPERPRANTIESACEILPGSRIPSGWCLLASRGATVTEDPSGRLVFDDTEGSVPDSTGAGTTAAEDVGGPLSTVPPDIVPPPPPCPEEEPEEELLEECASDPSAVVPDWTAQVAPFLNPRVCEYYVPIKTNYACPGAEELPLRVEEYFPEAIKKLMDFLNKDYVEADYNILSNFIVSGEFYEFDKAPNLNLQLLYKFPFSLIRAMSLEDRIPLQPDEVALEGTFFEVNASEFIPNLDRLSGFLGKLTRPQADLWRSQKTKIVLQGSTIEVNFTAESKNSSILKSSIIEVLSQSGFKLPSETQPITSAAEVKIPNNKLVADSIFIYHDSNYNIIGMFANELGGEQKEINIRSLDQTSPLVFPPMISYLSRLPSIVLDIETAPPIGVLDFARKYHYPPVRVADQTNTENPSLLPSDCQDGEFAAIERSILDSVMSLADEISSRLAGDLCMTPEQLKERNNRLDSQNVLDQLGEVLTAEAGRQLSVGDMTMANLPQAIEKISQDANVIKAAWEKLFNKMSVCGLFKLMAKTLEFISQFDVCGISAETALALAIKSALKEIDPKFLRDIYGALSEEQQSEILQAYTDKLSQYLEDTGYNGASQFPWDFEQQIANVEDSQYTGNFVYQGSLFETPDPNQLQSQYRTAYTAGYRGIAHEPDASYTEEQVESFWIGYAQGGNDAEGSGRETNPTLPPREISLKKFASAAATQQGSNPNSFSKLSGGLLADLYGVTVEILVEQITEILDFNELLEAAKDIPVIGTLISAFASSASCVVNVNRSEKDKGEISLAELSQNIQKAIANFDICDLPPAKKPITLPNIEQITISLKVVSLRSLFVNTLLPVLRDLLIQILLKVLLQLIKKATEVIKGAVCDRARGNLSAAVEGSIVGRAAAAAGPPVGNLGELFREAFCGTDGSQETVDGGLSRMFASATGSPEAANAALTSSDTSCSLVDAISNRLRMDQLLDLLAGTASPGVIDSVLEIAQTECVEFSSFLADSESVRNFFITLGGNFTPDFLNQFREGLGAFGADRETIATTCDTEAPNPLADLLREECGDQITEEQIQQQVSAFESRIEDIVSDFTATMTNGFDGSLTGTIEKSLQQAIPKDSPGNLSLASENIDTMFDPLYSSYSFDMASGFKPNKNNGFLNAVLSNTEALPLRGQFIAFNTAVAMLTGPAFAFLPIPPIPPFMIPTLVENIRKGFFGGTYDIIEVPEDPDAVPPVGPEPPPRIPIFSKKPDTVAKYLQDQLSSNGLFTVSEEQPETIVANFELDGDSLYNLTYEFNTGRFRLTRHIRGVGQSGIDDSKTIEFRNTHTRDIFFELDSLIYGPSEFNLDLNTLYDTVRYTGVDTRVTHSTTEEVTAATGIGSFVALSEEEAEQSLAMIIPGYGGRNDPLNVGTTFLMRQMILTGLFPHPDSSGEFEYSEYTREMYVLMANLRTKVLRSAGRTIAGNNNAFNYGSYNLDTVSDSQLYPAVDTELIESGYSVIYLEDGSIFVQPPRKGGWLELKDILLPETVQSFCCPDKKELLDLESIKARALRAYSLTEDDPRLGLNPRTVRQPPYSRPLSRLVLASIEGTVLSTIRVYIVEHVIQGYASFGKFKTNLNYVYDQILVDYIAEKIKLGIKKQPPNPGGPAIPPGATVDGEDRLYAYWYEFLEQCVQIYIRRTNANQAVITSEIDSALRTISAMMEAYQYPQRADLREARRTRPFMTLKRLRREKKIEAIRQTEQYAMAIMKQMIKEELQLLSEDIDEILPMPDGGWIENAGLEFLRQQAYGDAGRNIFDVPRPDGRILPNIGIDTFREDFENDSQFILESYIRAELNTEGSAEISGLSTNTPIGIEEMLELMEASTDYDSLSSTQISDLFSSFRYGLRLVYVPKATDFGGSLVKNRMGTLGNDVVNRLYTHPGISAGGVGVYTIPIIYSGALELEFTGTFGEFKTIALEDQSSVGSEGFNWRMITLLMTQTDQFRLMFEYAAPVKIVNSLTSIFNIEGFLDSIGVDDGWTVKPAPPIPPILPFPLPPPSGYFQWSKKLFPNMKRRLKRLFNLLYKSNDFNYKPAGASPSRREISDARADLSLAGWLDGLSPAMQERVIFEDPLCLREDSPLAETPRGTIPGYDGTVADRAAELAAEGYSATDIKDILAREAGYGERTPGAAESTGDPPTPPEPEDLLAIDIDDRDDDGTWDENDPCPDNPNVPYPDSPSGGCGDDSDESDADTGSYNPSMGTMTSTDDDDDAAGSTAGSGGGPPWSR